MSIFHKKKRRSAVRTQKPHRNNVTKVLSKDIFDDGQIQVQTKKIVSNIQKGKTIVAVYLSKHGNETVNNIRAVKTVKMAFEDPKIESYLSEVLENIQVYFDGNEYAGDFYRNVIKNKNIKGKDIKT